MSAKVINHRFILFLAALLVIAAISVWAVRSSTPYGLGLHNDSVQYVMGARNLASGNGYMRTSGGGELKPITTVPPLTSAAIAFVSLGGLEALRAARFLTLGLLGLDILLFGCLLYRVSRSYWFTLAGATLFASANFVLELYAKLMSEPLYIFIWLACFLVFDGYLQKSQKGWLILLGVLCGAAYLTRYIGAYQFLLFALVLLLFEPDWKGKITSILVLSAGFIPPVAGWTLRNTLLIDNPFNRTVMLRRVGMERINFGIDKFWDWVLPDGLSAVYQQSVTLFHILFFIIFGILSVVLIRSILSLGKQYKTGLRPPTGQVLSVVLGISVYLYLLMTLLTMLFIDASVQWDHRLLLPVYLALWIILLAELNRVFARSGLIVRIILGTCLIASMALTIYDGRAAVIAMKNSRGFGYASLDIQFSPSALFIKDLPPTIFYSTRPYMFYIVNDRPAYAAPAILDPVTLQPRADFQDELAKMQADIHAGRALFVFYKYEDYALDPWYQEITAGLVVKQEFPDAIIFGPQED